MLALILARIFVYIRLVVYFKPTENNNYFSHYTQQRGV
jgi:hypothetical protein